MDERRARCAVLCGLAVPVVVLVATLTPTVLDGDSANFARQAHRFGLAHPPGYPLVGMVGKVVTTCVCLGDSGWRAHWVAALGGAVSLALAYALMRRWGAGRLAAVAGCWLLAFSPLFWSQSIQINPYILSVAFALGLFLLLDCWAERRSLGLLGAASALYGLGMGSHPSLALYLPAVLLFVAVHLWRDDMRRKLLSLAVGLGGAAAGCLPWLLVTVSLLPEDTTLLGFLGATDSPSDWRAFFLGVVSLSYVRAVGEHVLATLSQFSPAGAALAAWGAFVLLRRRPRVFLLVALGYLAQMNFACTLEHWHPFDVYRLPTHTLTAMLAAVGLHAACVRLPSGARAAAVAAALVFSLGPPYVLLARPESSNAILKRLRPQMPFREGFARANRSDCRAALEIAAGRDTRFVIGGQCVILTTWGPYTTLKFLQDVEGVGVRVVTSPKGNDLWSVGAMGAALPGAGYLLAPTGRPLRGRIGQMIRREPIFEGSVHTLYRIDMGF